MRNAFADEITKLGTTDPRVVLLSGDIGNRLFDKFKQVNEGRFFNCGVAEANMMGVAAGMALSGMRPVIYTIAPFTTTRCFEQIRVDACYHEAPVIIVGTGAGLAYAELGPTHHSCEDLAILRVLPNLTVLAPADEIELRLCLRAALDLPGPVYMRIGKKGEPVVHQKDIVLDIGRSITVRNGSDVCLISTGTMLPVVVSAAEKLVEKGLSARVESFHTVKPLDQRTLAEVFSRVPVVAVVEEHSRLGGLGGSIAEWLAQQTGMTGRLISFGTDDEFMHEVGSQDYARKKFGLTTENIVEQVLIALDNASRVGVGVGLGEGRTDLNLIGLDFDNTIVSYDALFHQVALEKSLIPASLSGSKLAVRDYLRGVDKEDAWTELQGYVYGARMAEAMAYPGAIEFMQLAAQSGISLAIVSHKTLHPFLGPKYDLHDAARSWVKDNLAAHNLISSDQVFFELTKGDKIRRVAEIGCDYFIDDLPEILLAPAFPRETQGILFDPEDRHTGEGVNAKFASWREIAAHFEVTWKTHR